MWMRWNKIMNFKMFDFPFFVSIVCTCVYHEFRMWPIRDKIAASKRFLRWPNRIFDAIWNAISALGRSFHVTTKTAIIPKPHFESLVCTYHKTTYISLCAYTQYNSESQFSDETIK